MDKSPISLKHTRNNQVEDLMTQWRIHWEYVPAYPLADIKIIDGQQVRSQDHLAPKDVVKEYAEQARNGAAFPPIVLARDIDGRHSMVDGNTRYRMALELEAETFPVYVASVQSMDYARTLGAALNQIGGRRLTEREALEAVLVMVGENVNFTDVEIAQAVGIPASRVAVWRKENETEQRAKALGVAVKVEALTTGQRKELARIVDDARFVAVVDLLSSRRVKRDDLRDLIADVVKAPSDEAAYAAIAELAESLPVGGPRGEAPVLNEKAKRMRMLLPQIINMYPPETVYESERAADDFASWKRVLKVVLDMLDMYRSHGLGTDDEAA